MTSNKLLVYLVAAFALAIFAIANVSAFTFAQISDVEVNGVNTLTATDPFSPMVDPVVAFSGQTVPVRVTFTGMDNAKDVRVKAWIAGERELASISRPFDVIQGGIYPALLSVQVPSDLDELDETLELNVVIENRNDGTGDEKQIVLTLQRESYALEILDVNSASQVSAGDILPLDVVIKNIGRRFAEDTFVRARIDALGIEDRAFFGDLSAKDEPFSEDPFSTERDERLNKENTAERRLLLRIPSEAKPGIYVVEVEALNGDAITKVTKQVVITGAEESTIVVAPAHSRSFNVGETKEYSLSIVNSGNRVKVYDLVIESPAGLNIDVSDPVVAVPAGSSTTVKLTVSSDKAGKYDFAVNVHSGAELVKRESFVASIEGASAAKVAGSPAVLLTVVLAIIFVVLLIVLIVLLTRKPEKTEESGESYY